MQRFPCPGCGADMSFDPKTEALKCDYCGVTQKVSHPVNQTVVEVSYEEYAHGAGTMTKIAEKAMELKCDSCGSIFQFQPSEFAGTCPFCAAKIVAQAKAADPLIAPNAVLPFGIPRERAVMRVSDWLASRWFAPSGLKRMARPDGLQGIYVPFWTYDAHARSRYLGKRGDYYYETEYVTVQDERGNMVRRPQQVRRTRWSPASGMVENSFDDVLIPASRSISPKRLNDLDPWDLEQVKPYEPAYLSGFKAQRYQVLLPEGLEAAKELMNAGIYHAVRQDIGGDEQQVTGLETEWSAITFKHVLLPVWIGAYRFQSKVFQVMVNARTGEVQGERPYSVGKIVLLIVGVILAIALFAWLSDHR
ncbi:MAG: hypothetical protein SFV51_16460 [Bryobacteraceae bacterium]|nr:hypothetical protein [Bryobacteraceae bacterium]